MTKLNKVQFLEIATALLDEDGEKYANLCTNCIYQKVCDKKKFLSCVIFLLHRELKENDRLV